MVNILVNTGRKYGMEINIDKSEAIRIFSRNELLCIKIGNREQKKLMIWNTLKGVTRDGYCASEIKMRIAMAIEPFNRKNTNLENQAKYCTRKETGYVLYLEHCIVWLKDLDTKKIGVKAFGRLWNVVLDNEDDEVAKESN